MSKVYEIAFQMGGQISSSFQTTMRGANAALGDLQKQITAVNNQQKSNQGLIDLREQTKQAANEFYTAKRRLEQYEKVIQSIENPSKELVSQFKQAQRSADQAGKNFDKKKESLRTLNRQVENSSLSTRELVQHQQQLAASAEKARKAQAGLQSTMAAQQANMAKRQEMRGQLFDAVGLAATMAVPIKLAAEWEQSLAELNKVANATPDELNAIGASATRLAVQTGVAREGIIGAYTAAAQAGFAREEWASFAETSAKMGVAFDTTGEQAGEMLKAWRSGMSLTMDEATQLAAAANHLANNMNATAMGVGNVLQRQGAIFKASGIDQATGAALAASLLSSGASDEVAATAGKNFVLALTKGAAATKNQRVALEALGFDDPQALAQQMQEAPREAIMEVLKSIRSLDAADQTAVMTQLFGSESIGGIAPLIGNLENLSNAFNLVGDSTKYANSLEEEFAAMQGTTQQQAKKAMEGVKALGTAFGAVLLPPINSLLQTLAPMALWLAETAQQFPMLTTLVVGTAAALITLKVASIALGYAWTFVKGGALQLWRIIQVMRIAWMLNTGAIAANTVTSKAAIVTSKVFAAAQWLLNAAVAGGKWVLVTAQMIAYRAASITMTAVTKGMTAAQWLLNAALLANPIGLVITAIVGLIAAGVALYKNWDTVKQYAYNTWESVKQFAGGAIDWLVNAFMNFTPLGWIIKAFSGITNWLSGFSLYDSGVAILKTLGNGILAAKDWVVSSVKSVFETVRNWLPFSDAKVGPFSELTKSGAAIMTTLADGVNSTNALQQSIDGQFGGTSASAMAGSINESSSSGSGSIVFRIEQTINVGAGGDVAEQARRGASEGAAELVRDIEAAFNRERRLSYA